MGCIPSSPQHGGFFRSGNDDDCLTMQSFDYTDRSASETCPHHSRSTVSGISNHSRGGLSRTESRQHCRTVLYVKRPSFLIHLFQTIILFGALYFVFICANKFVDSRDLTKEIQRVAKELPNILDKLSSSVNNAFKETNSAWTIRETMLWCNGTASVDWDQSMVVAFWLAMVTLGFLIMDLLFSSEGQQGNPILLSPSVMYSVVYFFISIHAQAIKLLDPAVYISFNTTLIGEKIFSQPEMVSMTFVHLFALDLALAYAMIKDFYTRISSRRRGYRLLMIALVLGTLTQGISTVPFYLLLRFTILASPLICLPRRSLPANRNNHQRELDYLLDPVPRGGGAINGWTQSIPSPLNLPFVAFFVVLGTIRFFLMLLSYFLYVVFVCLPISAIFFSLRRSWKLLLGKEIHGALYMPFETVNGKMFPPKAVLVVSAHIRLVCFTNRSNLVFNLLMGWWLRKFMEAFVMYEFTLPFKDDFSPYVAFLMEEFGPVFPMGAGLGFGSYRDVKAIIENPDQRKAGLSLAWSISHAQFEWSKNNLTILPETEIEKSVVAEGRELVRIWLENVSDQLKKPIIRKRLDTMLPYANVDGTMVDKKLLEISFGSTLFHLLTGGELTEFERKRYYGLLTNAFPFMSDWINKVWFGGILEYNGIKDYDHMRRAFLRYLEAPALQRVLAIPEAKNWDNGWTPPEVVRFLVYKFVIAGGAAPAFILGNIVQKLYDDPALASKYQEASDDDRKNIILEISRLERGVPFVNFMAHNFRLSDGNKYVTIFNRKIAVPDGTPLHCSIQNANRDVTVFGDDAAVINIDRHPKVTGKMLTFNGNLDDIKHGVQVRNYDKPARRCPGYGYALDIIQFLVDRYCPTSKCDRTCTTAERLAEITSKETLFMKFVLNMGQATYSENNKYFPQASEVKHPMDSNGRKLGRTKIKAAGERYIPIYDEDVPNIDMIKDKLTSAVLKMAPITDDEGEWQSPEEARAWRMRWFNSNFPPVNTNYSSYKSLSQLVSELAFCGMCSLHTQKLESLPATSLARKKCKSNKAVYVNDNTVLGSYRVRRGYQRYGAAAYFDRDFHLIGVYTCCDGKYYDRPSKLAEVVDRMHDVNFEFHEFDEWRHALWAWRVSALALVTVADHLVNVHMIAANALVFTSRAYLPIDHPLRAFLKIFTYKTITINTKACLTLTMPKGVINRNWAFQDDDLQRLLETTPCTFKKNFKDYIPASMIDVKEYPANHDLVVFCDAVTELVRDFLIIVYDPPGTQEKKRSQLKGNMKNDNDLQGSLEPGTSDQERPQLMRNIKNDKDLQAFLENLAKQLGLVQGTDLSNFSDIVDVLTSLICNVTGMHELVGQISDYFADPKIGGTTIRRGKEIDSIQIYQLNCTLVSSTGLRMPRLMGNWEHLLVRNGFADATMQVMQKFQDTLLEISIKFDERKEKEKKRRFHMDSFNPVNMECSVSV